MVRVRSICQVEAAHGDPFAQRVTGSCHGQDDCTATVQDADKLMTAYGCHERMPDELSDTN